MQRLCELLQSGAWLTRRRLRLIAWSVLIASAGGLLFLVATAHGVIDLQGRPLGTDFSNVYAAGTYVLEGDPRAPFDPPRQYLREQELFGSATPFYGWHYPPYFLFVAGALAWMPYGAALAMWQSLTLVLYLLVMLAIVSTLHVSSSGSAARSRRTGRGELFATALLLAAAFPAVLINLGHGQNGFLTAALIGGGLVLLDRRPVAAGAMLGLLIYKPQFGVLLPFVLAASGRWRCFAAAAGTVLLLSLVTTAVFGAQIWHAFALSTQFSRMVVLEQGDTGWFKIQSVFSWARMWGAPVPLAYAIQGVVTLAVGLAVIRMWRGAAPATLKNAALCLATILATPYTLDYDMMAVAPGLAFVAVEGLERGFRPWEKTALAAVWLVPLVARGVAHLTLVPLAVPAMLVALLLVVRRSEWVGAAPTVFSVPALAAGEMPGHDEGGHDIAAFEPYRSGDRH